MTTWGQALRSKGFWVTPRTPEHAATHVGSANKCNSVEVTVNDLKSSWRQALGQQPRVEGKSGRNLVSGADPWAGRGPQQALWLPVGFRPLELPLALATFSQPAGSMWLPGVKQRR